MRKIILNGKFTSIPNSFFDLIPELTGSTWILLSILIRETLGWHRLEKHLSLKYLERKTGLHRTSVLKAREDLANLKVIEYQTCPSGASTQYTLLLENVDAAHPAEIQRRPEAHSTTPLQKSTSPKPEVQQPEPDQEVVASPQGVQKLDPPAADRGYKNPTPRGYKKCTPLNKGLNTDQEIQHQPAPPFSAHSITTTPQTSKKNDDVSDLEIRLKDVGVHPPMAARLCRKHPRDLISGVLDQLSTRKAKNPAAWVVSEIKAGGYGISRDLQADLREKHLLIEQRRRDEKTRDLEERKARDLKEIQRVEQAQSLISEKEKDELWAEAQSRALKYARNIPGAANLDSPIVKAEFRNLLLERAQQATLAGVQPKRGGWIEKRRQNIVQESKDVLTA